MKLTPVVQPIVLRTMTRSELVRAAEHAFPHPSRIVALMIERLRDGWPEAVEPPEHSDGSTCDAEDALQCPCCGGLLHINNEDNT